MIEEKAKKPGPMDCSFCGRNLVEVRVMISGPNVYICDGCIGLCIDLIHEEKGINLFDECKKLVEKAEEIIGHKAEPDGVAP